MDAIDDLRQGWLRENREACAALAAQLSCQAKPIFASEALAACLDAVPGHDELSQVVRIGQDRGRWAEAHLAFNSVRTLTLKSERETQDSSDPHYVILFVAENAAKVIYNATSPPDPFDDDSAAWLLLVLAQMARCTRSTQLEENVWHSFSRCATT